MTTKTLLILPRDVGGHPLGPTSVVADVEVTVSTDTEVTFTDGSFIAADVPFVQTSIPDGGLKVDVIPNDERTIVRGHGYSLIVTTTFTPRQGRHRGVTSRRRRIVVTSADPDIVPLGAKSEAVATSVYVDAGTASGVAIWTDPTTGERIPYLTAPSLGYLTTIGD